MCGWDGNLGRATVKHEKPVFYAEISQMYVPAAGVIEGVHNVAIRSAQGELSSLTFDVPSGGNHYGCD